MQRLLFAFIIILADLPAFSQSDLRSGYVVLNSGDTLKGKVEYREGKSAFKNCDFKQSNDAQMISYAPGQILGYGYLHDKNFISKSILTNQDSTMVFIEELVRGFASLYKFEDRYWIKRTESELYELTDIVKDVNVPGKGIMQKRGREYRGTMNMVMHDCIELKDRIEKLDLTEKQLTVIVEDYNRCKGSESKTFKTEKSWVKVTTQFHTGLNLSFLNVDDSKPLYMSGQYDVSSSVIAGVAFDFSFPRMNEKFSLHTEVLYMGSKYDNPYNDKNHMTANVKQLKLPLGVRYAFTERTFTPFIGGGFSYTYYLSKEAAYVSGSSKIDQTSLLANNQLGLWISTGVYKSITPKLNGFAEIRYERTNGIFQTGSTVSNLQLIIGLRLK